MSETVTVGDKVLDFILTGLDGKTYNSLEARHSGLLLYVFYKKGCGTCQFTLPFIQRFQEQYAGEDFQVWGIAQDSLEETKIFAEQYGITFPLLLDENLDYTDSYRLRSVPDIYLVDSSDTILRSSLAFIKDEFNTMAKFIAERTGQEYIPIVREEDNAPAIKPG